MTQPNANDETRQFYPPAATYARPRDQFDAAPMTDHQWQTLLPRTGQAPNPKPGQPGHWMSRRVFIALWVLIPTIVIAAIVTVIVGVSGGFGGSNAAGMCEDAIRAQLKAPSTATFSNVRSQTLPEFTDVEGSVDAENGFSAMIRTQFTCSIGKDANGNAAVTSAVIVDNN